MSTTIVARVRRVLVGHAERALVHAVDDAGYEYKIEIPAEAARGAGPEGEHVLLLAWSLQALPRVTAPTIEPAAPQAAPAAPEPQRPAPSAVDAEFMALMTRGRSTTPEARLGAAPTTSDGEPLLATLLGVGSTRSPG